MDVVTAALEKGNALKAKGAASFAAGQHADALAQYLAAVAAVTVHVCVKCSLLYCSYTRVSACWHLPFNTPAHTRPANTTRDPFDLHAQDGSSDARSASGSGSSQGGSDEKTSLCVVVPPPPLHLCPLPGSASLVNCRAQNTNETPACRHFMLAAISSGMRTRTAFVLHSR